MKEKQIQDLIIAGLNYAGCYVFRMNAGMIPIQGRCKTRMVKLGEKGMSDIIGLRKDGKFIAIEVKTPLRRGKVTFFQKQFLDRVKEMGGLAGVATSVEEAMEIIK